MQSSATGSPPSRRRALAQARAWRRARLAVGLAVVLALVLGLAVGTHDLQAGGVDAMACFAHGSCNRPPATAQPPPAQTGDPQPATTLRPDMLVTISRHGVHERVHVVIAARDPLASAYLSGRISAGDVADALGWVSVDGDDGFDDEDMRVTHVALAGKRLDLTLENDLYHTDIGEEHAGVHDLSIDTGASKHATVTLQLAGFRFMDSGAFTRPPDTITGFDSAHWNDLTGGTHIAVRTIAASASAPYADLRTAIENAGDAEGWFAVFMRLLAAGWVPLALLIGLRCLPRRQRASIHRPAMTFAGTTTAVAFGNAYLNIIPIVGRSESAIVATVTIVAALAFLWGAFRICDLALSGTAFAVTAGLLAGGILVSGASLSHRALLYAPAAALLLGLAAGVVALAPRAFARAYGAHTRSEPFVWASMLVALALAIGAAHVPATLGGAGVIAFPGRSALAVITFADVLVPALFLFLVLVMGRGLDPRAPRDLSRRAVGFFLTITSIGVAQVVLGWPIATLAGLIVIPLIALRSPVEMARLARARVTPAGDDDPAFDLAVLRADVQTACDTRRKLQEQFVGGAITQTDRDTKLADLTRFIDESRAHLCEHDQNDLLSSLFTSHPFAHPLASARSGAVAGAVLGTIIVAIGLPGVIAQNSSAPLLLLEVLAVIVVTILRYAIAAAAFVLFLPYFRGTTATTKGVMFALALIVASIIPFSLHMTVREAFLTAAPAVFFFPLIGAIFDALALRRHAEVLSLPQIFGLAGLGNFAAIGTVFASAIVSAATGELQHAASTMLSAALKIPPPR